MGKCSLFYKSMVLYIVISFSSNHPMGPSIDLFIRVNTRAAVALSVCLKTPSRSSRWYYNMHDDELDLIESCFTRICIIRCLARSNAAPVYIRRDAKARVCTERINSREAEWEKKREKEREERGSGCASHLLQNLSDVVCRALLIARLLIINDGIDNSPIMRAE